RNGVLDPQLAALAPKGNRRMGMNPHANGGLLLEPLRLPQFRDYAVDVKKHGEPQLEATYVLGTYLRDVLKFNEKVRNFRVVGPDETASNRLQAMYQAWLEGYLLTGRHGFFSCYEAFIHIVDSMFNQHAKWLKTSRQIPWRKPIA